MCINYVDFNSISNQSKQKKGGLEGKKRKIKKWATQIKRYKNWIKKQIERKDGEKPKLNEKKKRNEGVKLSNCWAPLSC